ncbi:PAS domain S-box protein [Candidatus Daviesbacteria bacterium]|nr:PAS domain S-box protein [Candidatus Daviesbacteria bacterium]
MPRAEKTLKRDTALLGLKTVADNSPNAILITNTQAKIVYVNKPWQHLTGYKLKEVLGKNPKILHTQRTPKSVIKDLWKHLSEGKPYITDELVDRRKDGSEYYVHASFYPIIEDNKTIFYFQTQYDITELKKNHLAQKRLAFLVENSNDSVVGTDLKTKILSWNSAAKRVYGYSEDEILHKPISILVPKGRKKELEVLFKKLREGKEIKGFETKRQTKAGKIIDILLTISPIKNSSGKIIGFSAIGHDITERKKIENLKTEFLSIAAHELKTPITTLKLISQAHIAKFKKFGSDQIKLDELELINRELERLTQLINDILDENRIESGKLFLNLEQVNLNRLFSIVIRKMQLLSKNIKIIFFKPPKKIILVADGQRLEQVLVNLISNAIKYSKPGSKIDAGAKMDKKNILFWIKDWGVGIPKDKQRKIFDRFYQIEEKSAPGFGLGLFITKEIIKLHRGKIWVDSTAGKGLPFRRL